MPCLAEFLESASHLFANCHSKLYLASLLGTSQSEGILSCRSCHVTSSVFESLSRVVPRSPQWAEKGIGTAKITIVSQTAAVLNALPWQLCFPQQSLLGGLGSLHSHRSMAQAIALSSALPAAPLGHEPVLFQVVGGGLAGVSAANSVLECGGKARALKIAKMR